MKTIKIIMICAPLLSLGIVFAACSIILGRPHSPEWVEHVGDKLLEWAFDR